MKTLKLALLFVVITVKVFSHELIKIQGHDKDVGVVERLGDAIPAELQFVNENDELVSLRSLIDKPTILSLVYFDCPGLCSPMLDGISNVIEKTDLEFGKDYQIITVSFNYKDNPEKAKEKKATFLKRHSKNHSANWIYLTGDSTNIYRLCNAIGFKFKRKGDNFVHPSVIVVISPKAKITKYLYGITFVPFDFKASILEAKNEQVTSTFDRAVHYGFTNNQATKTYAQKITKIAGSILLFAILLFVVMLIIKGRKKKLEFV